MCDSPASAASAKPRLADVFRRFSPSFTKTHDLPRAHRRVLGAIAVCRTAALGGYAEVCPTCGDAHIHYCSCRNRHCPSCQAHAQGVWVAQREQRILPVGHFHVVFTLPAELRALAMHNPKTVFDAMFSAASATLQQLGRSRLGGEVGATVVLHTWTRDLQFHPHLHCVVTGGALAGGAWASANPRFLFPVGAMRKLFRGILRRQLLAAGDSGALCFAGDCADLGGPGALRRLLRDLHRKRWVVYIKAPFAGAVHVFRYLGRYTHRVGISDQRMVVVDDAHVTFRTRGDATVRLSGDEFLRRFLLHVLPERFHKIRHFGLYASAHVNRGLPVACAALGGRTTEPPAGEPEELPAPACKACGTALVLAPVPTTTITARTSWERTFEAVRAAWERRGWQTSRLSLGLPPPDTP